MYYDTFIEWIIKNVFLRRKNSHIHEKLSGSNISNQIFYFDLHYFQ